MRKGDVCTINTEDKHKISVIKLTGEMLILNGIVSAETKNPIIRSEQNNRLRQEKQRNTGINVDLRENFFRVPCCEIVYTVYKYTTM